MFREYFKNKKIKRFLISMAAKLANDYGRSNEYSEGQVKTALKSLGYEAELEEVAIAIFCNEEIAKNFGIDEALIKRYRGYPQKHSIGIGTDGVDGGFGGGDAGASD